MVAPMTHRIFRSAVGVAVALSLGMTAAVAQQRAQPIASDTAGALLPPEDWTCDLYVQEYRDYLEQGGDPENWRYAGKRYRSADDGEIYDWAMWLEWEEEAGCPALAPPESAAIDGGAGIDGTTALAIIGALMTTAALAAGGGGSETAKSPG